MTQKAVDAALHAAPVVFNVFTTTVGIREHSKSRDSRLDQGNTTRLA